MSDPIADMLTRIRNAIAVRAAELSLPYSSMKYALAKSLVDSGFIAECKSSGKSVDKQIIISINQPDENPKINHIKRLSRPGRRYYTNARDIPLVKRGRGIVIISTSKGLMTGAQAKKKGLGGELICEVY